MTLNDAEKVFVGALKADAIYLGSVKVWPRPKPEQDKPSPPRKG